MNASIIVAAITASASVLVAALSFYLTKRHQLSMEWRGQKLNHYKVLLSAISDLAIDKPTDDANYRFALAANTIALVGSQAVINALMEFHDEIKLSNRNKSLERHDELLKVLLLKIRQDIGLSGDDDPTSFQFHLIGFKPSQ